MKLKLAREATHSVPTHIKVGGGEQVGEGIVVSLYDEQFVHEVFLEVVGNGSTLNQGIQPYPNGNFSQLWSVIDSHRWMDATFHPPPLGVELLQGHQKRHLSPDTNSLK